MYSGRLRVAEQRCSEMEMKHSAAAAELRSYQEYMVVPVLTHAHAELSLCRLMYVCMYVQKETVPLYKKQILQLRTQLTAATGLYPTLT